MNVLKVRQRIINILEYVLVFLIILDCNSVWQNTLGSDKFKILIIATTIILLIFLIAHIGINIKYMARYIVTIMILFVYLGIFYISSVSSDMFKLYFSEFYVFFPAILLCIIIYSKINERFRLFYKISDVTIVLSIISLILWLLCSIFKIVPFNDSIMINWGGYHAIKGFYNIYYQTQSATIFGYEIIRNTGIFTEGPMYSLCLSISLLIEFFLRSKINKKRILILILAMISTISTAGYIVILLCILGKFITDKSQTNKYIKVIKVLLIIIMAFLIIFAGIRLFKEKMNTHSYNVRVNRYILELSIWKSNKLFGNGFGNNESGSSNSIGVILADGGIWLITLYIIAFLIPLFKRKYNKLRLFFLGIIWLVITTVFPYSMLLIMVLSMSYSFIVSNEKNIRSVQ